MAASLCRACSLPAGQSPVQLQAELAQRYTICTGLQVETDDGLPFNICDSCLSNLNVCYDFVNTCKRACQILRMLLATDESYEMPLQIQIKEEQSDRVDSEHGDSIDDDCASNASYAANDNVKKEESLSDDDIPIENIRESISKCKENKVKKSSKRRVEKIKIKPDKNPVDDSPLRKSEKNTIYPPKKNYTCPVCDTVYVGKSLFKRHMAEEHVDYKKYVCRYCPKAFAKSQYLKQHMITHTGKRSFACDMCPKMFKQQCQLIQHKKLHSEEKPYKCDKCDMSFHLRNRMISHSKHHDYNVHHLCHLCGHGFAQLGNLMVHMRIHTGEKPYGCSTCSFRCSVQSGLRRHERTHVNSRPHVCSICQKAFNNSGSLGRHERIHSGELPYKCSLCSLAFIDSWKRKTHLMKVHHISKFDIPRMFPGRKKVYTNDVSNDVSSYMKSELG